MALTRSLKCLRRVVACGVLSLAKDAILQRRAWSIDTPTKRLVLLARLSRGESGLRDYRSIAAQTLDTIQESLVIG